MSVLDGFPQQFSKQVLSLIIEGIVYNENGLSAEILIMLRDEVSLLHARYLGQTYGCFDLVIWQTRLRIL